MSDSRVMRGSCGSATAREMAQQGPAGALGLCAICLALATSVGCFDADALIEEQRAVAMRTRLEEIELGEFRVTLPHAEDRHEDAELGFHVFCQVANSHVDEVEKALEDHGPEIRHRMLIAARTMTTAQLEDPELKELRSNFVKVVNESLAHKPVQSVGFYRFNYSTHKR